MSEVELFQSNSWHIFHAEPFLCTRPFGEGGPNKSLSVPLFGETESPALATCADPSPMEIDDPMAEQISAGFYGIAARDIAGRVNGLQVQVDR